MDDLQTDLGVSLVDQDQFERDVAATADKAINEREVELDKKRLEKTEKDKAKAKSQIRLLEARLEHPNTKISTKQSIREQIREQESLVSQLERDILEINSRLEERREEITEKSTSATDRISNETEREYLIRTGKITPFANINGLERASHHENGDGREPGDEEQVMSHRDLREPGFEIETTCKRSRLSKGHKNSDEEGTYRDEEILESESSGDDDDSSTIGDSRKRRRKARKGMQIVTGIDDGDEKLYPRRISLWCERRSRAREKSQIAVPDTLDDSLLEEEFYKPHPTEPDTIYDGGYAIPGDVYLGLFDYQKTCVQWLWELHCQGTGGIIGDEMGLGKTIQIIAFLAGLHHSKKLTKPVIVVCPATVMKQWVNEFHKWWPPLRVVILHSSGSGMVNISKEEMLEKELISVVQGQGKKAIPKNASFAENIVNRVVQDGHILITTFTGTRIYRDQLLNVEWGYCILDEGHKIRNPDSEISLACKQIKTVHRIILSGTPMQNNLVELWSLFDFVYPGRLGTLPVFQQHFAVPINIGGYANATNVQVQTAYKCACVLRDLISPYLLRRMKVDVAADLPKKSEQVLFCKLSKVQRAAYEEFIGSKDMESIYNGKRQVLYGVDILRKICNHPDLPARDTLLKKADYDYGMGEKSGKMQVVKALLELWKKGGHRTLLFTQTRQMLDILEKFAKRLGSYEYRRMDGSTPIGLRQSLVDEFNENTEIHLFLLTTRVGGLGINLTGADRVIIYDPDWNPSTDVQARERAWRLGQKKDVTIYRLLTVGTIEEKIYHRQIFKQFLTNKILKDPKQRRFFKTNDLHDLFSLTGANSNSTETGDLFHGSEISYGSNDRRVKKHNLGKNDDNPSVLTTIGGVAGIEEFQTQDSELQNNDENNDDDTRILANLFESAGVHSALEHDSIMNASRQETVLVAKEASRVAKQAVEALLKSRREAQKVKIGTPTWTGRFGRYTFDQQTSSSSLNNLSSSILLANMKARQDATPGSGIYLIDRLRDFLSNKGGRVRTFDLVKHFSASVVGAQQVSTFKMMIKEIATLEGGFWVLKKEFE
ncbi:DNA repair protein rhp26 [Neolecta irregularis DAH-3]|uniref:DNA repair protein rhp26 n=1 Tax=Neolecta irregularis (strain DAH-3) TaxID=1198029 RepID=A0A1U7LGB8_NEOID|nr:DNA repair protein rhp26 [Neolecta irregularis DAH-3]|eukprot:OLL21643.1 DNA repair protein rhp26 [Neolecta irregularis DAH-3]